MRVIIGPEAVADIDGLGAWVAKDDPKAAQHLVETILQTIERLGTFPKIGHPGTSADTFERAVSGTSYLILYEVSAKARAVQIIAVFNTNRDPGDKRHC